MPTSFHPHPAPRGASHSRSVDRHLSTAAGTLLLSLAVAACAAQEPAKTAAAAPGAYVDQHYPDFGYLDVPANYHGRVFRLSQRYPTREPDAKLRPAFLDIDFRTHWRDYLLAARAYCFADNVLGGDHAADSDYAADFDAAARSEPTWFHVPWQHYGPNGREGVHGLTKEAPAAARQLAPDQIYADGQFYAVGLYNVFGGYTIGRVWADKEHPDPRNIAFPIGTVVMKLLFTDVPNEQVPALSDPLPWHAWVTKTFQLKRAVQPDGTDPNSTFKDLWLIQMDLMVRDPRAPTGWVFGNYHYNGAQKQKNKWDNLVPLGIQWGNDPKVADGWGQFTNPVPFVTRINPALQETIINPDTTELPPTHLGWNGRLNGPADNFLSSCMSCHMTAQAPSRYPLNPTFAPADKQPAIGSTRWVKWFENPACGTRFDPDGGKSGKANQTDNSLQLAASLQNFYEWRRLGSRQLAGHWRGDADAAAPEGEGPDYPVRRN